MSERILVTGGCGLIGSSVVERALERGHAVTVLDNLSTGRRENLSAHARLDIVVGDVCDDALVGSLVRRVERVVHLAAGVGVGLVLARPTGLLRQALLGTESVLRHAAAARRPLFFASSSEVYGENDGSPLREDRCLGFGSSERIRFTYAAGKAAGEALAFAYAHEYSLPVVVGRFFNVTGPRQTADYGAVVPNLIAQAVAGGPLRIHGDGQQTRSFIAAEDAAEYVLRLLEAAPAGGLLVNVGRQDPVSILGLAHRIRMLVDPALEVREVAPAYGQGFAAIRHRVPDVERLRRWTGYLPRRGLDEILRASLSRQRKQLNR